MKTLLYFVTVFIIEPVDTNTDMLRTDDYWKPIKDRRY